MDDADRHSSLVSSLFGSRYASIYGIESSMLVVVASAIHQGRNAWDFDVMMQCGLKSLLQLDSVRDVSIDSGWLRFQRTSPQSGIYNAIEAVHAEMPFPSEPPSTDRVQKTKVSQFRGVLSVHSDRARRRNAEDTLTLPEWGDLLASTDWRCSRCESRDFIEVEHMIPLSRGGGNTADNVCPMCARCNSSKGARTPLEWIFGAKPRRTAHGK